MKNLFITLVLLLAFALPAAAQSLADSVLDAGLAEIASNGDVWVWVDALPADYTDATTSADSTGARLAYTGTITKGTPGTDGCATGAEDYEIGNYAGTGGGRGLTLCNDNVGAITEDTATSGTAVYMCVLDTANTAVLGCVDVNGGTGTLISDGDTVTYGTEAVFVLADIVDAP